VNLGFEGVLTANINLDLLRLGFGLLGQGNPQHAPVVVGAHLPYIDGTGSVNERVKLPYSCLYS